MSRKTLRTLLWNLGGLVVVLALLYFAAPTLVHKIAFEGVALRFLYVLPWTVWAIVLWQATKQLNFFRRRAVVIGIFTAALIVLWDIVLYTSTGYFTYNMFAKFEQRTSMVPTNAGFIRYSAIQTADLDMSNFITAATEKVKDEDAKGVGEYTMPLITNDGFGYIAPILPDGLLVTYTQDNPGFVVYDDRSDARTKVRRVDQPFEIGPEMLWFDNLDRQLIFTDFFATYEKPHFLQLDPKQPNKFVAAIPKIKFRFWRFPFWGGVVLVHDDGTIEDLSREEALADKRLKGQWIAPIGLTRYYVELQNYDVGWGLLSPYVNVTGKLEIPKLPGDNQFPFITRGADDKTYFVTATKAALGGAGMYRMYYTDASTGEGSYFEYEKGSLVYGPTAGLDRVQNLPGFNWYRRTRASESGNMLAIEPVYIVHEDDPKQLFWKFSITNTKFAGVSAVVVASAKRPDEMMVFERRSEFEAWLRGGEASPGAEVAKLQTDASLSDEVARLRQIIEGLLRDIISLQEKMAK